MRLTRMGFVFQHMNMLSNLNIIDNITFPAVRADKKHKSSIMTEHGNSWMISISENLLTDGLRKYQAVSCREPAFAAA